MNEAKAKPVIAGLPKKLRPEKKAEEKKFILQSKVRK